MGLKTNLEDKFSRKLNQDTTQTVPVGIYRDTYQPEPTWREKYLEVLNSKRWQELRKRLISERFGCERCGQIMGTLQLHHKTYERLGCELDEDLELLCLGCHPIADSERAAIGRRKSQNSRLDSWASKKYGDDWGDSQDQERVSDEFEEWLDRQDD